jgi:hypothetical protein
LYQYPFVVKRLAAAEVAGVDDSPYSFANLLLDELVEIPLLQGSALLVHDLF